MALATATLKAISARFSIGNRNTSFEVRSFATVALNQRSVGAPVYYTDHFVPLQCDHFRDFARVVNQRPDLSQGPLVEQEILHGPIETPSDDWFGHIVSAS
jgi:hypothetical protein